MDFSRIEFLLSVHKLQQLPEAELPEIAFAGRSNVGKSSLINTLTGRKALVKVSSKPGKTQGLNYFNVDGKFYLVDLPGYGYAKVPKGMQNAWETLISSYLTRRETLRCVVVIIDIRHEPKQMDTQLLQFLRDSGVPSLPVYTKVDKVSGNQRNRNASRLDAGHGIRPADRILFSARNGQGRTEVMAALEKYFVL